TNYNAVVLPASYAGDFEQHPVGTGPFTLAAYAPKETATFKRNPDYRQAGLPYLDGVEFRFFAETQPQVLALEAGAVDLMGATAIPQRTQNYDRARQLLREAGAGTELKITLTYEVYQEVPQYAVYLQEMLRPAGISVTLDQMTQGAYYGSGGTQPWLQVPMGITDWASRTVPSQFIGPAYTCDGVWNSAHWCDPEFDGLAKQYDATLDTGSRRAIARKMALLQQDATPAIIAYWIRAPRAVRKRVRGVDASGSDFLDLTRASLA